MPVKRRVPKDRLLVITPEIVALFQKCEAMQEDGSSSEWEPEGRREEYLALAVRLHALLGRGPHEEDILDVGDTSPPAWMSDNPRQVASYVDAWETRQLILDKIDDDKGRETADAG